ncbi:ABC transporter ATP-binding protein [Clostridioides difficile]
MENILEVYNLNKTYTDFSVSNISFALPEDCITGFIGVNGAGKTTTIRSILDVVKRDSGKIKIFGKDFDGNEKELKNRIGVVFDDSYFYEELSMAEMKSIIAPSYDNWCEEDYQQNMKRFNLNPKQKIDTLSKGMKMKFALALALSHKAEFLIMDEPTSGLDPLIRSQILDILTGYMKKCGRGVFFSTHITSDLDKIADMIVMIDNGRIILEREKDTLLDEHRKVKGDIQFLNDEIKKLFLNLEITGYGFIGITSKINEVQKNMPDILIERPTIEDIMLAYIERRE